MKSKFIGLFIILFWVAVVWVVRAGQDVDDPYEVEPHKIKGSAEAPISILEFSDFTCTFCGQVQETVNKIIEEYPHHVNIHFKHFLLREESNAGLAAEATECAADQRKFWEYHDYLFKYRDSWIRNSPDVISTFSTFARELGMNEGEFEKCLTSGRKTEIINRNQLEGQNYYILGTPTFILNGNRVIPHKNYAIFRQHIKKEIEKLGLK